MGWAQPDINTNNTRICSSTAGRSRLLVRRRLTTPIFFLFSSFWLLPQVSRNAKVVVDTYLVPGVISYTYGIVVFLLILVVLLCRRFLMWGCESNRGLLIRF